MWCSVIQPDFLFLNVIRDCCFKQITIPAARYTFYELKSQSKEGLSRCSSESVKLLPTNVIQEQDKTGLLCQRMLNSHYVSLGKQFHEKETKK